MRPEETDQFKTVEDMIQRAAESPSEADKDQDDDAGTAQDVTEPQSKST